MNSSNIDYLEFYKSVRKELYETKKELEYQQIYAQAAWELYDDQTQVSHSLMILKGLHVDLLSEYLRWKIKNPDKDQPQSKERLDLLGKHLDLLSKIQTDNFALKNNSFNMRIQIVKLKQENEDLKKRLQLHTANL